MTEEENLQQNPDPLKLLAHEMAQTAPIVPNAIQRMRLGCFEIHISAHATFDQAMDRFEEIITHLKEEYNESIFDMEAFSKFVALNEASQVLKGKSEPKSLAMHR